MNFNETLCVLSASAFSTSLKLKSSDKAKPSVKLSKQFALKAAPPWSSVRDLPQPIPQAHTFGAIYRKNGSIAISPVFLKNRDNSGVDEMKSKFIWSNQMYIERFDLWVILAFHLYSIWGDYVYGRH